MQDQSLILLILAVVAFALVIQAVALARVFLAMRRLEERFEDAESELRALQPRIERLGRVIDNVSQWTDSAAEHVPRIAKKVENRMNKLHNVAQLGALALVPQLRRLATVLAVWKGIKSGARRYRELRPSKKESPSPWVSAYTKDTH